MAMRVSSLLSALLSPLLVFAAADVEPGSAEILERQLREVAVQPAQALMLHMSAGNIYQHDGRYESAARHYDAARALAAQTGDSEQLVSVLSNLGTVRFRQGRLLDARHELEMARALASSSTQASVVHRLANVLRELGQYDAAIRLYQQSKELGLTIGLLDSDMGDTYARHGDLDRALGLLQVAVKSLKGNAQMPASADFDLAAAQSVLGSIYHVRGDLTRAGEAYRRAWRSQSRLRVGHPDLVATELRQARLQRDLGEMAEALDAVETLEAALVNAKHEGPELRAVLTLKADFLREQHRYKDAEDALDTSLAVHSRCCAGEDHPEVAVAFHIYGSTLHDERNYSLAHGKYDEALRMFVRTLGPMNPETAAVHNSLGTLHQDMGNIAEAQQEFTRCLDIQLQTVGAKNPDVSNTYNNLATVLSKKGDTAEAALLLEKALQVLDAAGVPASNPERKVYMDNLAMLTSQPLSI